MNLDVDDVREDDASASSIFTRRTRRPQTSSFVPCTFHPFAPGIWCTGNSMVTRSSVLPLYSRSRCDARFKGEDDDGGSSVRMEIDRITLLRLEQALATENGRSRFEEAFRRAKKDCVERPSEMPPRAPPEP